MAIGDLAVHTLGDMTARYLIDENGRVGLGLQPTTTESVQHRQGIGSEPYIEGLPGAGDPPAREVDPLVHLSIRGDGSTGGWAQGRTMRWSPSNDRFAFDDQRTELAGPATRIVTVLRTTDGLSLVHRLSHRHNDSFITVQTEFVNESDAPVVLDALSSFSLSGLSPFDETDSANRLVVHRLRSSWSAEARPVAETLEELHLERSWLGIARLSERFGQVGTMPTRGWFPFVGVEDIRAAVTWGAHVAWAGSWQLEVARMGDDVCLSGGLADLEYGHWSHTVAVGERLLTPTVIVSCTRGSVDDLTDRLVSAQLEAAETQPEPEATLPVVFNEWCTTWGEPRRGSIAAIADRIADTGIRYLVIDAGWYRDMQSDVSWGNAHGDWVPSPDLFPNGLRDAAALVIDRGMVPGLWFEFETVGKDSTAFSLVDHLLKRDGTPITVAGRRFWDFTDPFVIDYLSEKVIDLLESNRFGYLKIDYNETIGLGADHPDGPGEGLRQQVLASYAFIDRIRERLPHLVIENCASGGHRLEPSMIGRTAMSSFSDAHELPEIPIIAGNLLRSMLPRQMQIWSVLRSSDSEQRLVYSLAATFLGRMCLSGDVLDLDAGQWDVMQRAIALYQDAAPVIRSGRSRRTGEWGTSLRHPSGWQSVTRYSDDGTGLLVVVHAFEGAPQQAEVALDGEWSIKGMLHSSPTSVTLSGGILRMEQLREFGGVVVLLTRA